MATRDKKPCPSCSAPMDRHSKMCRPCRWAPVKAAKAALRTNLCATCGVPTPPPPWGGERKYCSRTCAGRAVGRNGIARLRHLPSEKTCLHCQTQWSTYHREQKYCSRRCSQEAEMKNFNPYAKRVDKNQADIVDALRKIGASVLVCSHIGGGFPD